MQFEVRELLIRVLKYLAEGLAIAMAMVIIPRKPINVEEIAAVALIGASVFALLDMLAPAVGLTARQGAGFGLGAGLVGGIPIA
jgi:hypothetical protein